MTETGSHARARAWGILGNPTLVQFVALALVWGASFLFIKESLAGLSPVQVATGRVTLGALTLATIMIVTRRSWPRGSRLWVHLVIGTIPLCVLPMLLYSWAGQYLPSSLESIYNATTPLMTMLIAAVALSSERLSRIRTTGLLVGAIGVLIVLGPWTLLRDTGELAGTGRAQLACLVATFCYGIAYNYTRRFISPYGLDAIPIASSQVAAGAVMLLGLTPFIGLARPHLDLRIVASMLTLGALGTGVAYAWNNAVIKGWGATNASTVTYLIPIVGVLLGVLVLGERISWNQPVGAVVVILGILLSQNRLTILADFVNAKLSMRRPAHHPDTTLR